MNDSVLLSMPSHRFKNFGISHVGQAVFVIEPDRQQAIVIQCLSAARLRVASVATAGGRKIPPKCRRKFKAASKNICNSSYGKLSGKRDGLLPEHRGVRKRSREIQSIHDEKRNMQKETAAAREDMRKIREDITQKEECFLLLSDKVDEAELEAELRGLQTGEERRGSNACPSRWLLPGVEQISAM